MAAKTMTLSEAVASQRHGRVLLAQNDGKLREHVSSTLMRAGFDLVQAATGDEALDRIADQLLDETEQFDVVVADLRMAGCTGLDLLACLRHFDWHTPVILITRPGSPEPRNEARRLGAFAVLDEPVTVEEVEAAVMSAVPRRLR